MKANVVMCSQRASCTLGKGAPYHSRRTASKRGFTLVELLVVIAILVLLAAMSLPALCKTNGNTHGLQCLSNTRALTAAWLMYSVENKDQLLSSASWVLGSVADPSSFDFVDTGNLVGSPLNPYLRGNVKVYRCPSDPRKSTNPGSIGLPRARGYSMNNHIGTYFPSGYSYFQFSKLSHLNRPGPANTFVILDEGPTINDGWFMANLAGFDPRDPVQQTSSGFGDLPSFYHNRAGNFAFADGHGETHKWKQFSTTTPPTADDVDWLQSKTTAKITSPTR